ncbi:MAG: hypothetical protein ACI857_003463 [Arenicella sp.]|jgi:hypothetical protein
MKIRTEIKIEKNPKATWEIIGNQFGDIAKWASFFKSSKATGENKFEGINFSARDSVIQGEENTHSLYIFDSQNYILAYTVTAGAPPFADLVKAQWALESSDENSCTASIEVNVDLKDMVPEEKATEVTMWLTKSGNEMLEELKYYTETGNLHQRKLNQ